MWYIKSRDGDQIMAIMTQQPTLNELKDAARIFGREVYAVEAKPSPTPSAGSKPEKETVDGD